MNKLRQSFFSRFYARLKNNVITDYILETSINIGLADFIYRNLSKNYLKNRINFFEKNKNRVENNINALADDKSKEIYKNMIYYRCYRKRNRFPKTYKENEMYFDKDIITLDNQETLVDCGAYIGDTLEEFTKKTNNKYNRIIAFEPDEKNFKKLIENTKEYKNIDIYNYGVWNENTILRFNEDGDVGSNLSDSGSTEIKVVCLESIEECNQATFIKMDIEGAELNALKGAENIIKQNKPKLAICLYHSDDDMIDIIEYIHNIVPQYKIYVRHYSNIEQDTVMYCI